MVCSGQTMMFTALKVVGFSVPSLATSWTTESNIHSACPATLIATAEQPMPGPSGAAD